MTIHSKTGRMAVFSCPIPAFIFDMQDLGLLSYSSMAILSTAYVVPILVDLWI